MQTYNRPHTPNLHAFTWFLAIYCYAAYKIPFLLIPGFALFALHILRCAWEENDLHIFFVGLSGSVFVFWCGLTNAFRIAWERKMEAMYGTEELFWSKPAFLEDSWRTIPIGILLLMLTLYLGWRKSRQ